MKRTLVAGWLVLVIGCGGSTSPRVDASMDAASRDAASHDAASHDANADDAASRDANAHDADLGDAADGVSCDRRPLSCRVAEPICPENQVAQIIGNCFGPCVPIDQCVCTEAAACPHEEMYTCHMYRQRCGPYVN